MEAKLSAIRRDYRTRVTETPNKRKKRMGTFHEPQPMKVCGGASGPCESKHISEYPPEEQARMMSLFKPVKEKAGIATIGGDKLKQMRR